MRFRLGYVSGFATGYYLGTKAGRQRYDQINRALRKLRRSDALETAAAKARMAVEEGVEKAKDLVERRPDDGASVDVSSNGPATVPPVSTSKTPPSG